MHTFTQVVGLAALVLAAACGNDEKDSGGAVDAGDVICTTAATATPDIRMRAINSLGSVQCNGPVDISIETCVQWNPSGTFEDIQCQNSTDNGVEGLQLENLASCGVDTGRRFRTRVNATVDGTAKPETLSSEVGCE